MKPTNVHTPRSQRLIQQIAWFFLITCVLGASTSLVGAVHYFYENFYLHTKRASVADNNWDWIVAMTIIFLVLFIIGFMLGIFNCLSWLQQTQNPSTNQLESALRQQKQFWVYSLAVITLVVIMETIPSLLRNL